MALLKPFSEFVNEAQSMMDIDQIHFGHPTREHKELIDKQDPIKEWFINSGEAQRIIAEAPTNTSETTRQDLEKIEDLIKNLTPEQIAFSRYADNVENCANMFIDILRNEDPDFGMGDFFRVDSMLEPLIFFLKDKINRPRPYQLAKALNVTMHPVIHTDACSAAYPSGHAAMGFLISEYYGAKYPNLKTRLVELGQKIADSRVQVGIHFPSDSEISKQIVKIVMDNNLIDKNMK